ncbi:MAG: hypothetical protein AAF675_01620 [Pseudomonadota bacterium]
MAERISHGKGMWIETLFDPGHPNVYIITIPSLALFALGVRRGAVVYLFASLIFVVLRNEVNL